MTIQAIKLSELREAVMILFDHIEKSGNSEVVLDDDYYWSISDEELYSPYQEPANLALGQLYDDLDNIRKIASGTKMPVSYDLHWLASLLRYIGYKVVA